MLWEHGWDSQKNHSLPIAVVYHQWDSAINFWDQWQRWRERETTSSKLDLFWDADQYDSSSAGVPYLKSEVHRYPAYVYLGLYIHVAELTYSHYMTNYHNLQTLDILWRWNLVIPAISVSSEPVLGAGGGKISANYWLHPDKADILMFYNRAQIRNRASYLYSYPPFTHMWRDEVQSRKRALVCWF